MNRYLKLSSSLPRASRLNSVSALLRSASPRTLDISRSYATHSNLGRDGSAPGGTRRRQITVMSDDGRLPWSELSGTEKAARATQQSFNFVVVLIGAVMTGGVFYFLFTDVLSPNSPTRQFDKAVDRIKDDPRCTELLGDPKEIVAHGSSTGSRWARNRPIATNVETDQSGREHLKMQFWVEGPRNEGHVNLHMVRQPDQWEYEYLLLAVDIKGHQRIYLENAADKIKGGKGPLKIFGIQWR
ncbi:hypothetical protein DTO166G4_8900 [Paecilomyces variotii]|uniref:Mitochondrial import inner membrane translocase subunit Tim21 n=1 Tax=Byssochlamys spectabilis TaxID=264951 RepID=A0A443HU53_BYSSP|nr:TIM21-domain-containing protein [Paecilomyces variotii]KAJ9209501.1 hypothetical protein DTO166G4_8900 [Paecilomyces variotii]KAJ9236574.1 hypothetical protein DTO166G5_4039 [Paecilomyces variotii]KAJ9364889.1 hypothetical protein DTO280E4_1184 [Paecilomyces variotii]RWQ95352.1 TIM21-domain-containing protein [Paecilomyces variotii]